MAEKFFNQPYFNNIDFSLDNVAIPSEQTDYTSSINPQTILKNPQFLQDLRDYYEEKEGRHIHWSNEELIDNFYADSTWRELNTVSAIGGAFEPWGMGTESRERAKRIESVWKQLPMFWQEGGRGAATALPDIAGALIADPLNLIPVGAAATTAKAAIIGGKTVAGAVARGAGKAALAEGGIAGAQEGVVNASTQARDIQLGLRDDFSKGELALATGLGATIGGVVGGGLGIPGALAGVAAGRNTVDSLLAKGLTRQQIAELGPEALAKSGDVNMYGQPPVQQADEAIVETAEEVTQEPTIDQLIAIQRQVIDTLSKDGAETEEASTILGLLEQAKEFDEVISPKAEDYIRKLEAHGTEKARRLAAKERIALNNLRTIVENIKKGDAQDFDGDLTKILAYLNDNALSKKVRNIPLEGTPKTGEVVDEVVDAAEEVADAQKVVDAEAPPPEDNVVTTALAEDDTRRVELNKVMDDEVIDILDEAGIDPFIVAPAPRQKRVSMAQARRIIKRKKDLEGQPSDSPALIAQEQLEKSIRVLEATTGKEVTPTERSMLARVIESDAGLKRNALYIEETDLKKLADEVVPEKEWIGNEQLTPDEIRQYKIIKRRFAKKAADAPEGSDLKLPKVTEARARIAFLEQRSRQPGQARTTGKSIDDAGIYTTAGREESGKIQGIMKRGEFTGEGGGSPGSAKISKWTGEPLGRRKFKKYGDRETAYVESKKYPKSSPNRLVGFYNARSMRVIDENGKEVKVTPGTLVYADGHTKKVFLNKEAAFKRTGLKAPDNVKQEELIHKANKKMPTAEEIASREASAKFAEDALGQPLPEKLSDAEILQEAIDNGDGEALLKALRAIENGEELSPNQNTVKDVDIEVAPVTKGDKRLIVQNKNNAVNKT